MFFLSVLAWALREALPHLCVLCIKWWSVNGRQPSTGKGQEEGTDKRLLDLRCGGESPIQGALQLGKQPPEELLTEALRNKIWKA